MINRRGLLILAIVYGLFGLLLLCAPVKAADSLPEPIGSFSCRDIRAAVALFPSIAAAEKAARAAGASDEQIRTARACLRSH